MKKIFGLFILSLIATTGCTVVVSEPHPRYIVSEVGYRGERPAEVYFYSGHYYYAPCSHIESRYYHQRVTYYNSHSMRIVHHERPRDTIIIKEAPHTNTVIIKENNYRNNHDTVVIKEAAPRGNTVVIKEESHRHNTVVVKEPRHNTVVVKEPSPRQNTVVIKDNKAPNRSSSPKSDNKVIIKK